VRGHGAAAGADAARIEDDAAAVDVEVVDDDEEHDDHEEEDDEDEEAAARAAPSFLLFLPGFMRRHLVSRLTTPPAPSAGGPSVTPVLPPPTPILAAQGATLASTVSSTAPDYQSRTVDGLPGPTAADLALAARPNMWVEQQRSSPPTPSGPARRRSWRPRSQAAPTRPVLGVRDGTATHLQEVAEIFREEWDAVTPATIV